MLGEYTGKSTLDLPSPSDNANHEHHSQAEIGRTSLISHKLDVLYIAKGTECGRKHVNLCTGVDELLIALVVEAMFTG